jgi:superfamily II DNA or RNA helicase
MLQSLVLKDYEPEMFEQFGLTIIDEVHHISSQTFSTSLFKLVTKYMLGLSATMERKDGTTNVFKMFLGDVIHKAERKHDNSVEVRALYYKTDDPDFRETITDWRGNTQISSMLNKLCGYNRRTEFILKALTDYIRVDNVDRIIVEQHKKQMDDDVPTCAMCNKNDCYLVRNTCCDTVKYCMICMDSLSLKYDIKIKEPKLKAKCPNCKKNLKYEQNYIENPYVKPVSEVHTIVMSQNLSILHYMYNKIVCRNLASVGYYVGGMKESELKETEGKQIILSSYAMASEGLDIPSLTTEFLITPKTDVVQIVGRILRAKHPTTIPTIYDFVDVHDVFHRQWSKRKSYYKKQNYRIITTDNITYSYPPDRWKVVYEPIVGSIPKKKEEIDDSDDEEPNKKTENEGNDVCLLRIK